MNKEQFRQTMSEQKKKADTSFEAARRQNQAICNAAEVMEEDVKRIERVIDNAPAVIHDINQQFEMATKLRGKDIAFLFGAAALQTLRWALLPRIDWNFDASPSENRMTSQEGGLMERKAVKEHLENAGLDSQQIEKLMAHDHINTYTWEKLLVAPVPYDAMLGSERIVLEGISEAGVQLYGKNHHVATWGHDPIMGWVIGPLNITSRMITFRNFETYHVRQMGNTFQQCITYRTTAGRMVEKSIQSWATDSKRLFASVAKQGMHLQSDKYTKGGLPIPLLSAATAQRLLLNGWNSAEVERLFQKALKNLGTIGAQFGLALIIDNLVKALHLLCYDELTDGPVGAYSAKTHKIVCYSNLLAEVANGIFVVATHDFGKLDIGGYINLAKNLIQNQKLQTQLKAEFLEKELAGRLYGEEYYFLGGL